MSEIVAAQASVKPIIANGYFDESGKWTDSAGVFVFAGFVAFLPIIGKLTVKWGERLRDDKMSHSSMKDAIHFRGCYEPLKEFPEKRDALIRDLAQMFVDARSTMLWVRSSLDRATLDDFRALPQKDQEKFGGDPYYAAFEACILGALEPRVDTVLHTVCDISEEYAKKCIQAFHKMRKRNPVVKARCAGITFSDDTWAPPLQMADMLAYCARAEALKATGTEPHYLVSELIETLQMKDAEERHVLYRLQGDLGGSGEGQLE